jgi:hypothetical protein
MAQHSGPAGNGSFCEVSGFVVAARHAGVEMDLPVSRKHTISHERASVS